MEENIYSQTEHGSEKKNYKLISYKLFVALVIIMLTSGIIFGFDKVDLFLFAVGSLLIYIVYKRDVSS